MSEETIEMVTGPEAGEADADALTAAERAGEAGDARKPAPKAETDTEEDPDAGEAEGQVGLDAPHLRLGHRPVGFVLHLGDPATVVVVPHDADEEGEAAVAVAADGLEESARLEGLAREVGQAQPPASGGRKATESPGRTGSASVA